MTKTVKEIVAEIKETLDKKGGLKHVYFVACGGSKAAIFPGLYLLQSEAKTFSATTYTSNEFVHATPKELDDRCVAVICSLKATAETVEAVKKANSIGAITIAMTGNMDTGMAKVGQYVVTYSNGDDQLENISTAVVERPIPSPLMADVVVARVGHIPNIRMKVGFSLIIPLYRRSVHLFMNPHLLVHAVMQVI